MDEEDVDEVLDEEAGMVALEVAWIFFNSPQFPENQRPFLDEHTYMLQTK